MHEEKTVSYTTTNTYYTLNTFSEKTTKIWIVCHGISYLSSYFLEHFKSLNPEENYIIAPQAPSKYYQDKRYKYIGASWFTRLNIEFETQNIINYLNQVYQTEAKTKMNHDLKLIIMGYSQGVSAITRWLAKVPINCSALILHSGSVPKEFDNQTFEYLKEAKVYCVYGDADDYLSKNKMKEELNYLKELFDKSLEVMCFEGKHEVHEPSLITISNSL